MPVSVEFEPVKLGTRRRRVDPLAISAMIVVLGVVVAVLKPWDAGAVPPTSGSDGPIARASPSPSTPDSLSGPHSTAAVTPPRLEATSLSASWDEIRSVVRPHDAWGIRAIVIKPSASAPPSSGQPFAERWYEVPDAPTDPSYIPTVDVDPSDLAIVALGITFPRAHTPLDTRVWSSLPNRLAWVDTQPMSSDPAGGAFLYRPVRQGSLARTWNAGTYRIDVLVDGQIRRFGVTIPNRFSIVPEPTAIPGPGGLVSPNLVPISDLATGLFATSDGVAVPLPAAEGPALTEVGAWLDVDPGTGRAPRSFVASSFLPRATGLGVALPAGSVIEDATVGQLAPDSLFQARPDVTVSGAGSQLSYVGFLAPGGGAWPPGVYRFHVLWSDGEGLHNGTWHVELRPGPLGQLPSWLLATRSYARFAGRSGVVVGTGQPADDDSASVGVRLLLAQSDRAAGFPARDLVRCDGVRIDGLSGVVGIARPVDAPRLQVTARVLYEFSRSEEQPILTADGNVRGLTLVAPAGDAAAISTPYRVRVGGDANGPGITVCLGIAPVG